MAIVVAHARPTYEVRQIRNQYTETGIFFHTTCSMFRFAIVDVAPKVTGCQSIFNWMEKFNWCFIFACLLVFSCVGSGLLASFVHECQLLKPRFATMHACNEFQINNLSNASWIIEYMINRMIKLLCAQKPDKPKYMQPTSTQAQHTHTDAIFEF